VTAFGVVWFFVLLAPTSSVVALADVLMEHRLYLASWGVFLAAAVLASSLVERWSRPRWFTAVVICLCLGLALASYLRVGLWQSKLALWSDCAAKSPRKARVHHGLGNAYGKEGNMEGAIAEFRTALALAHDDPLWVRQEIRGKLAATFLMQGRPDDALAYARSGLAEEPEHVNLLGAMAMAYLQQRNLPAAEAAARHSVHAATAPAASLQILAAVHRAKGDKEGELADLEQAVRLAPYEPQGRLLLARAYWEQGRREEACAILRAPAMQRLPQVIEALAQCPAS
jgi:tetratricopeptide (TPR) repeat protein